jgi:hypothetical protein
LELSFERGDAAFERAPVAVSSVDAPGGEEPFGDLQAALAELFLRSHPFGVRGEVANQVRPAHLAAVGVEPVVGPPAVGTGDPGELFSQQRDQFTLVPVWCDPQQRCRPGERAPEGALAAPQPPAGLVEVDRRRVPHVRLELLVGSLERVPGALHDRVDRSDRELDSEQFAGELGRVAAGDTVANRKRHHRCLQPGAERGTGNLARELGAGLGGALRAAHAVQPVFAHPHSDRRQLRDLMTPRLDRINPLRLAKHVRARPAPLRPILDHLIDLLWPKQPPVAALVPLLPAPLPARPLPSRPLRSRRRILRRRQRRVPRTPVQTSLELGHPSLEPLVRLHQPLIRLDQPIKPKQQPDRCLTITIQDRLRLGPLHTNTFAARPEVPSPPERLPNKSDLQEKVCRE